MSFPRQRGGLTRVATTGTGGFALENGTPTILTWTAPDDGQLHTVIVAGYSQVTSAFTGGPVTLHRTALPWYNVVLNSSDGVGYWMFGAGAGGGNDASSGIVVHTVQPGETITLTQDAAVTAGAAVVYAEFWAS